MRILHRSSDAILDCLMREMAVTKVSIALGKSPVECKDLTVNAKLNPVKCILM